ncbi:hypothetical protein LOTGIDRAFT_136234, partial [Lottia gigantea]
LKDFSNEVRATRDVQKFLKKTVLLLDLEKTNMDEIIDEIVNKMLKSESTKNSSLEQTKSAIFTHDFGMLHFSFHQMSRTLQSTSISEGGGFDYDQNWVLTMCSVPSVQTRHVGIARLSSPANLGNTAQEVYFVIVILTPTKEKGTKNELEIGRTFATLFADSNLRLRLLNANTEAEFNQVLEQQTHELSLRQRQTDEKIPVFDDEDEGKLKCGFLKGLRADLKRRLPHYWSDYKDGVVGPRTIQKTISTTFFLYFACVLPCIAFGVLNAYNTHNILTVEKVLYAQTFGGLVFAVFGGTPQIVLLTTAPLALYTKIIYSICEDFDINFQAMFTCVGLWNSFFLIIYSFFDLSILMQFSTRSSEEIFALFISIAFAVDAFKNTALSKSSLFFYIIYHTLILDFEDNYYTPACSGVSDVINNTVGMVTNTSANSSDTATDVCGRDISMLYLFLLLGTLWVGVVLFNFTKTPYLNSAKRELLADYSLPVSVVIMSFFGAYVFREVNMGKAFDATRQTGIFQLIDLSSLSVGAIFGAMGLGFCLSLLFFMDQNISAALVNAPQNKMKKGTAYHWDLLVISLVNGLHSIICFPWVHAALPHSPLHVRALADVEERVDQGHIYSIIVRVRETRLTAIFSHILIGCSLFFMQVLAYIPTPVLYGLFLYVAVTSLYGNQFFERVQLFFTEQAAYPPNHYIRRVPQRKMHTFTLIQLVQLLVLCGFGFAPYPYLKMFFPVLIFALIPIRHKLIPKLIDTKFLKAMDGH